MRFIYKSIIIFPRIFPPSQPQSRLLEDASIMCNSWSPRNVSVCQLLSPHFAVHLSTIKTQSLPFNNSEISNFSRPIDRTPHEYWKTNTFLVRTLKTTYQIKTPQQMVKRRIRPLTDRPFFPCGAITISHHSRNACGLLYCLVRGSMCSSVQSSVHLHTWPEVVNIRVCLYTLEYKHTHVVVLMIVCVVVVRCHFAATLWLHSAELCVCVRLVVCVRVCGY